MNKVFVIQNQHGQFLSRQKEWLASTEISQLYKTPHRDLAINELVEITAKDTDARAKVVAAETSNKGLPLVADLPPLEFPKFELPDDMADIGLHAASTRASDDASQATGDDATAALENDPSRTDISTSERLPSSLEQV
jgi:hypothetical protein